eukprot:2155689-Rhodomonas_salina.1
MSAKATAILTNRLKSPSRFAGVSARCRHLYHSESNQTPPSRMSPVCGRTTYNTSSSTLDVAYYRISLGSYKVPNAPAAAWQLPGRYIVPGCRSSCTRGRYPVYIPGYRYNNRCIGEAG